MRNDKGSIKDSLQINGITRKLVKGKSKVPKNYQNAPLYKMRVSFDGIGDLSENHDRYLYSV